MAINPTDSFPEHYTAEPTQPDFRLIQGGLHDPIAAVDPQPVGVIENMTQTADGLLTPFMPIRDTESREADNSKYDCFATDDPELIREARSLVASRYLHLGFVTEDQIEDGVIKPEFDPQAAHSTYYVLTDKASGAVVATSRRIHYDATAGEASFPVWEHKDELDPKYVEKIESIGLENAVEIASLVRNPAFKPDREITMRLYRKMFQDAWEGGAKGERLFMMACKPSLFKNFRRMFDGSMEQMGPELDYPGEKAVPAMFDLVDGSAHLIEKAGAFTLSPKALTNRVIYRKVVNYMLDGIDISKLAPEVKTALEDSKFDRILAGSPPKPSTLKEHLQQRKPEAIASIGLLGYTALRTVAVAKGISPETDVDWKVFLGIEVATTPTYTYGMGDLIRSYRRPERYSQWQRAKALMIGGGSLIAPYAYVVGAGGENIPPAGWAGIGAFGVVGAASFTKSYFDAKKTKAKKETLPESPQDAVYTQDAV